MAKVVIVETNPNGEGYLLNVATGETAQYCYDDGELGNVYATIKALIDLGILNRDDFVFFDGIEELLRYVLSIFD